jgi:hypothetical protein
MQYEENKAPFPRRPDERRDDVVGFAKRKRAPVETGAPYL